MAKCVRKCRFRARQRSGSPADGDGRRSMCQATQAPLNKLSLKKSNTDFRYGILSSQIFKSLDSESEVQLLCRGREDGGVVENAALHS